MDLARLESEIMRLSTLIDNGVDVHRECSLSAARLETEYREAYAKAFLVAKAAEGKPTVAEIEAHADLATLKERLNSEVAKAMAESAKQALYARRSQLSALQSLAAAHREEAAFARTAPMQRGVA